MIHLIGTGPSYPQLGSRSLWIGDNTLQRLVRIPLNMKWNWTRVGVVPRIAYAPRGHSRSKIERIYSPPGPWNDYARPQECGVWKSSDPRAI